MSRWRMLFWLVGFASLTLASAAAAAGLDGQAQRQPLNWTAIAIFSGFVALTLWITRWAAGQTKTASDFYTAGGKVTPRRRGHPRTRSRGSRHPPAEAPRYSR